MRRSNGREVKQGQRVREVMKARVQNSISSCYMVAIFKFVYKGVRDLDKPTTKKGLLQLPG